MELVVGTVIALATFFIGRWDGKRSERAIRSDVSQVPVETATMIESVFGPMIEDAYGSGDSERGWLQEYRATVGYANLTEKPEPPLDFLIEYPAGAHSMGLLIFEDDPQTWGTRMIGHLHNGVGTKFHVGDFAGDGHAELGTVDYVQDLPLDRPLADAPVQAVYYRWDGSEFREVRRGEVWDPRKDREPPSTVRRLLGKSWNLEAGLDSEGTDDS